MDSQELGPLFEINTAVRGRCEEDKGWVKVNKLSRGGGVKRFSATRRGPVETPDNADFRNLRVRGIRNTVSQSTPPSRGRGERR